MFGYVKPFKPHMRICEYDTYKAVYCGLCKILGKEYGFVSRMTLSYDFAFLGLMALALNDSPAEIEPQRCIAHPCCCSFEMFYHEFCVTTTFLRTYFCNYATLLRT